MKLKSDVEILKYLTKVSTKEGVKLTPTTKAFFIELLKYFVTSSDYDKESGLYFIQESERQLGEELEFSYRMVCAAMQALEECGLIQKVEVEKEFKRLSGGEFILNKPNFTYIDLNMFMVEGE